MTEVEAVGRRTHLRDDLRKTRRYWELKEEAEHRESGNESLSIEHKEEIHPFFHKYTDLLISSILNNKAGILSNPEQIFKIKLYCCFVHLDLAL